MGGTDSRGGAKKGGWIGSEDMDDVERLSILMCGVLRIPKIYRLIFTDIDLSTMRL
jgi:hypothetical protein